MNTEEQKALIEQYLNAYNSFDIDGMVALVHSHITFRNISEGNVTAEAIDVEQFKEMANQSKSIFSSRRQQASNFVFDGNSASVDIFYEGTLATDLPNGMKAGEKLQLTGKSEFEFKDGKIISLTDIS